MSLHRPDNAAGVWGHSFRLAGPGLPESFEWWTKEDREKCSGDPGKRSRDDTVAQSLEDMGAKSQSQDKTSPALHSGSFHNPPHTHPSTPFPPEHLTREPLIVLISGGK